MKIHIWGLFKPTLKISEAGDILRKSCPVNPQTPSSQWVFLKAATE
jgi:hypothetical protein